MTKTICLAGLLAVGAGSVYAAASSVSSHESITSLILGAGLFALGLFGRRKRLSAR
jgi:hypothetical protein